MNILNILYIFCTCTRYSYIVYPECFVCRGGGDSFLFIKKKTTTTVIRNFQPVVLVFLYSIPGAFCLSGGGGIASSS